MTFTTTQKIIKVGSSSAITVPAKVMRQLGASNGDDIEVEFKAVEKHSQTDAVNEKAELVGLTQSLIKRHEQALKNLSQR